MSNKISMEFKEFFKTITEKDLVNIINNYSIVFLNKELLKNEKNGIKNYKFNYVDVANDYGFYRIEYGFYKVKNHLQIGKKVVIFSPSKVISTDLNDDFLSITFNIYINMKLKYNNTNQLTK